MPVSVRVEAAFPFSLHWLSGFRQSVVRSAATRRLSLRPRGLSGDEAVCLLCPPAGLGRGLPFVCLCVGGGGGLSLLLDGGQRCIMFNRFGGVSPRPVGEGLHFFVPWLQVPHIYDIRTQPKVITTTTGTRDLQMVSLSLRLLYRPNEGRLPVLHQTLGPDFAERVLPSIGNEVLKAVVARYDAESLLTQRDRVSQDIREHITQRAKNFDIELDDVAITHLSYGKEFSRAIEEKQVAQQESERIKFVVAMTEQEKKAAVVKAEGEAEAASLISKAIKEHGGGLIEVRRLDAAREIADALAKSKNVTYLPQGVNMLFTQQ
ncbi:hypothetical protein Efla_001703 [Eimeria flavescens]